MNENKYTKGFTQIPNDLIDNMSKMKLGGYARRILLVVIRKTFGFQNANKKNWRFDYIAHSQIMEMTGIKQKQNVWKGLRELKDREIILKMGRKIGVNPDAASWVLLPKKAKEQSNIKRLPKGSSNMITEVIKNDVKSNTKRRTQYNTPIQKKKKLDIIYLKKNTGVESIGEINRKMF